VIDEALKAFRFDSIRECFVRLNSGAARAIIRDARRRPD
jgi:hypothetical protein